MFEEWARLYDSVYAAKGKDYAAEVRYLSRWMGPPPAVRVSSASAEERLRGEVPAARRSLGALEPAAGPVRSRTHFIPGCEEPELPALLDVACGTGEHLSYLSEQFQTFGLDVCPAMLAVARQKLPGTTLFLSDMTSFGLGRTFDVVTCLFSSIGYLRSVPALERAVGKMASHLRREGVLLIEPPISPQELAPPETTTLRFRHEGHLWERETSATTDGETLRIRFVYRVAVDGAPSPAPVEIVDEQPIRLFTNEQILGALEGAGLEPEHDTRGPTGLGLYIGRRTA